MIAPDGRLFVHMNVEERGREKAFDATLVMRRREMSAGVLRGLLLRYPLLTVRIVAKIHFEALKLWLKRAPVYFHPGRAAGDVREGSAR